MPTDLFWIFITCNPESRLRSHYIAPTLFLKPRRIESKEINARTQAVYNSRTGRKYGENFEKFHSKSSTSHILLKRHVCIPRKFCWSIIFTGRLLTNICGETYARTLQWIVFTCHEGLQRWNIARKYYKIRRWN